MKNRLRRLREKLPGWVAYYRLAETASVFETLDGWVRRRLRMVSWRQWKHPQTR